jgi:hypothetical protein
VADDELNGDGLNDCPGGRMDDTGLAKGFVVVG